MTMVARIAAYPFERRDFAGDLVMRDDTNSLICWPAIAHSLRNEDTEEEHAYVEESNDQNFRGRNRLHDAEQRRLCAERKGEEGRRRFDRTREQGGAVFAAGG